LRLYPADLSAIDQVAVLRTQAVLAAEAGFDGVMVSEHHADFPSYLPNPIQLSELLLAVMPRGWVAPCPLLLPLKPYALIAEDLAWMAAAFPGRVGAGFAAGALKVDFDLAEVPFDEKIERFKAALPRVVDALRGNDTTPLGDDRAVSACAANPVPMAVAAQSPGAVRRAAKHDLAVLYDSLQGNDVSKKLSDAYDEAGGTAAKILIRRLWIGDPPTEEMAAQMKHYRSYAPDQAVANWGDGDQLVAGATAQETAERLRATMVESNCDTINVRIQVTGLSPDLVRGQLELYGEHFGLFREAMDF
jgi:alkanesulfonate monooxygenase SsuD/methylene tetrahydromethanopterin reductase-like flavin-dependent oxidoreductase (luciferase family)